MTNTITLSVVPALAKVKLTVEPSPVAVVVVGFKAIVLSIAIETLSPDTNVSIPVPPVIDKVSPSDIVADVELSSTMVNPEFVKDEWIRTGDYLSDAIHPMLLSDPQATEAHCNMEIIHYNCWGYEKAKL